ncbi:MAG: non-canonical purine NTP pyrophosphatase [Gaiellaceae bacterium]
MPNGLSKKCSAVGAALLGRGLHATLCSANEHKARELQGLLPGWRIELLESDGYPEETGATYEENARLKARFGREVGPAERWMLGDDSGIEIEALGWGPGIRSARVAGGDEAGWALTQMGGRPDRRARMRCELVAIAPNGSELRGSGTLEGTIAVERRGEAGFGYDPVFVPDGETRTTAELGEDWKAKHSHRALAAQALVAAVRNS